MREGASERRTNERNREQRRMRAEKPTREDTMTMVFPLKPPYRGTENGRREVGRKERRKPKTLSRPCLAFSVLRTLVGLSSFFPAVPVYWSDRKEEEEEEEGKLR